ASMNEPERWEKARRESERGVSDELPDSPPAAGRSLGSLGELIADQRWRTRALIGLGMAAVGLATYWGIFALAPELVAEALGLNAPADEKQASGSVAYLLMNFTGGLLGLLSFAPLASWRGRRFAFAAYHIGAIVTVPLTFLGAQTYAQALALLPVMAFFVV